MAPVGRVQRPDARRKSLETQDPTVRLDLEQLIEPLTRGDPESPLRWTCKSACANWPPHCVRGH